MPTRNYNITYVDLILEGRRHDSAMLANSGLLDDLEQHVFSTTREPMALYGELALILCVFTSRYLTEVQELHRKRSYATKP